MTESNTQSNKIFSPNIHGVLDYLLIVFFVITPAVIDPVVGIFAWALYALAALHFAVTLATRFGAGMFDGLSFRTHGIIELLIAILLVVSPWLFQFADNVAVRNTYVVLGVLVFVVWLLTEYRPKSARPTQQTKETEDKPKNTDNQDQQKEKEHKQKTA